MPWCVYKIMNLNIFSDLRKPGLVPGKSLSPSTKFDSVLEKKNSTLCQTEWEASIWKEEISCLAFTYAFNCTFEKEFLIWRIAHILLPFYIIQSFSIPNMKLIVKFYAFNLESTLRTAVNDTTLRQWEKIFWWKICYIENAIKTTIGLAELVSLLSLKKGIEYALITYILKLRSCENNGKGVEYHR